ncbi:MAG: hypothetical protein ACR5K7_00110 [Symbiopectobacterium sp.]
MQDNPLCCRLTEAEARQQQSGRGGHGRRAIIQMMRPDCCTVSALCANNHFVPLLYEGQDSSRFFTQPNIVPTISSTHNLTIVTLPLDEITLNFTRYSVTDSSPAV